MNDWFGEDRKIETHTQNTIEHTKQQKNSSGRQGNTKHPLLSGTCIVEHSTVLILRRTLRPCSLQSAMISTLIFDVCGLWARALCLRAPCRTHSAHSPHNSPHTLYTLCTHSVHTPYTLRTPAQASCVRYQHRVHTQYTGHTRRRTATAGGVLLELCWSTAGLLVTGKLVRPKD